MEMDFLSSETLKVKSDMVELEITRLSPALSNNVIGLSEPRKIFSVLSKVLFVREHIAGTPSIKATEESVIDVTTPDGSRVMLVGDVLSLRATDNISPWLQDISSTIITLTVAVKLPPAIEFSAITFVALNKTTADKRKYFLIILILYKN